MAKVNYYNKGMAIGKVTRSEIVNYKNEKKKDKHFLSMTVDTMDGNRGKVTLFPTQSDPNKAKEIHEGFPIGTIVEVVGRVGENEFTTGSGRKAIDRSITANKVDLYVKDENYRIVFILQGIVESIKQIPDGALVKLMTDESYEDKDGNFVQRDPVYFNVQATEDLVFDSGIEKGCNAKFKGRILDAVEYDDYGDIVGSTQMFKVEGIESVVLKEDLVDDENDDLEANPFD